MKASRKSVFTTLISVGVVLVLFSCWQVLPVLADLTGDIQGTVLDAANAGVPDAKVTIKNLQTGATRTVLTNQAGEFSAPQLEIGKYRVSVEKTGFKIYSEDAVVKSGEKTRIDAVRRALPRDGVLALYGAYGWLIDEGPRIILSLEWEVSTRTVLVAEPTTLLWTE